MAKKDLGPIGLTNEKTEYVASFTIDDKLLKDASKNGDKLYLTEDVDLREHNGKIERNCYSKNKL